MKDNREDYDELEYDSFDEFEMFLTNHRVDRTDDYASTEEPDQDDDLLDDELEEILDG